MKRLMIMLMILSMSGCSPAELRKEILGMSMQDAKSAERKYARTFNKDVSLCFAKSLDVLKQLNSYVLRADKKRNFILACDFSNAVKFCIDSTQVGILIKRQDADKTQIEVVSQNYHLAEFVSAKLFAALESL